MALSKIQLAEGFNVLANQQIHNPCETDSPEYDDWGMGFILGLYSQEINVDTATPAESEGYHYALSLNQEI